MNHSAFLEARLIFLVGPPCAGQDGLVEQMLEVGLVGADDVVYASNQLAKSDGMRFASCALEALQERCTELLRSNDRSLVWVTLWSKRDYDAFVDVIEDVGEVSCVVVMDVSEFVLARRHRDLDLDPIQSLQLKDLVAEMGEQDARSLGAPSLLASVLSIAIEGQDEW